MNKIRVMDETLANKIAAGSLLYWRPALAQRACHHRDGGKPQAHRVRPAGGSGPGRSPGKSRGRHRQRAGGWAGQRGPPCRCPGALPHHRGAGRPHRPHLPGLQPGAAAADRAERLCHQ